MCVCMTDKEAEIGRDPETEAERRRQRDGGGEMAGGDGGRGTMAERQQRDGGRGTEAKRQSARALWCVAQARAGRVAGRGSGRAR